MKMRLFCLKRIFKAFFGLLPKNKQIILNQIESNQMVPYFNWAPVGLSLGHH
jgi:hypothetical protein